MAQWHPHACTSETSIENLCALYFDANNYKRTTIGFETTSNVANFAKHYFCCVTSSLFTYCALTTLYGINRTKIAFSMRQFARKIPWCHRVCVIVQIREGLPPIS